MPYTYRYRYYRGKAIDPDRNVNPSLLMDRERTQLRDECNADRVRARVLAELARRNGRAREHEHRSA